MYVGRTRRGLLWLFGNIGIYYFGMMMLIYNVFGADSYFPRIISADLVMAIHLVLDSVGLLIVQVWDSRRLCRIYNERVREDGRPPW